MVLSWCHFGEEVDTPVERLLLPSPACQALAAEVAEELLWLAALLPQLPVNRRSGYVAAGSSEAAVAGWERFADLAENPPHFLAVMIAHLVSWLLKSEVLAQGPVGGSRQQLAGSGSGGGGGRSWQTRRGRQQWRPSIFSGPWPARRPPQCRQALCQKCFPCAGGALPLAGTAALPTRPATRRHCWLRWMRAATRSTRLMYRGEGRRCAVCREPLAQWSCQQVVPSTTAKPCVMPARSGNHKCQLLSALLPGAGAAGRWTAWL